MPVIDGEKNLDKLSNKDVEKVLAAKSSSDFLNIVTNQKNKAKAVTEKSSAEQVEQATHAVNPETYEANLNEQTTLLVNGAQVINERIEELKKRVQEKDEKKAPAPLHAEEMNVGGASEKESDDKNGHNLDI